jgi:hypothetical protein
MGDNIWTFASALAWPIAIAGGAWIYKDMLSDISSSLVLKFKSATKVKIGALELEGEYFPPKGEPRKIGNLAGNGRWEFPADKDDLSDREKMYSSSRYLMLCHKIAPSNSRGQKYDISVFLVRKSRRNTEPAAKFEDVESVTYYIGKFFGEGENGSKFVVSESANGFAMKTSAYGEPLCVAQIKFKDGGTSQQYRFLDFSMGEVFEK